MLNHSSPILAVPAILLLAFLPGQLNGGNLVWRDTQLVIRPTPTASEITAEFWFCNAGNGTVRIVSVTPSCGCLVAQPSKELVHPGESGVIGVELALAGREGRQEKAIAVATDDAPGKPTILKLVAEFPDPVALKPRFVFWRVGELAVEKEIEVFLGDFNQAKLGEVLCAEPTFHARLIAGEKDGRYCVKVAPTSTSMTCPTPNLSPVRYTVESTFCASTVAS